MPRRPTKAPGNGAAKPPQHPELPFDLPVVSAAQKRRAASLLQALDEHYPDAHCELHFRSPHELLIATILSAQCTDAAVNKATPALFAQFPTPQAFAQATPADIEPLIRSLGFFRMKAKAIHQAMAAIVENHGGQVPQTMDELLALQGVARKTASVVLGNAFGINAGIPVDTHVQRLSRRLNLAPEGANVATIERYLIALFPRDRLCDVSQKIIWHGRRACKARPPGGRCTDHPICQRFGAACELRVSAPATIGKTPVSAKESKGNRTRPSTSNAKAPRAKA